MLQVTINIKITCDECGAQMPEIDKDNKRVAHLSRHHFIPIPYRLDWRLTIDRQTKEIKAFCPDHHQESRNGRLLKSSY